MGKKLLQVVAKTCIQRANPVVARELTTILLEHGAAVFSRKAWTSGTGKPMPLPPPGR
jgi:hypothetical protein